MRTVLFVGQKPETVDFSDPAIPPGFNAAKIHAGIDLGMTKMRERGWRPEECMITPDPAGRKQLVEALTKQKYDCVVVGGGLRLPPKTTELFEIVVNEIIKNAPHTPIAFNITPEDTADAAARWIES